MAVIIYNKMNKFQASYYIVVVLFILTLLAAIFGTYILPDFGNVLALFGPSLLINGYLVYVLSDWRQCV